MKRWRVRLNGTLFGTRRSGRLVTYEELRHAEPFGSQVPHFVATGRVRVRLGRRWLTGWRKPGPWLVFE